MSATGLDLAGTSAAREEPPTIEVRDVGMVYRRRGREVVAVDGCSFAVRQGERAAIIGPSGCGKSTILRMLADVVEPTSGEVRVAGTTPSAARRARAFALVSQQSVMLPWRRLSDNVALGLQVIRASAAERERRVREAIDLVGLNGFEANYPAELSGGMRQRAAIARALTLRPGVLLLDEPFGALDEFTRTRLNFELLRILDASGATLLMITHSISEAVLLSDVVFVMSGRPGRIVARVDVRLGARTPDVADDPAFHNYERTIRAALAAAGEDLT